MRVNRVAKAQKAQGNCGACHQPVEVGEPYNWIKNRFGPKRVKHARCGSFRASEMTTSDKLSRLYAAQESIEDFEFSGDEGDDNLDDARSVMEAAADEAEQVGEEYRESASNIEDGFGSRTYQCDELDEKADACDEWADTLRSALDSVDDEPDLSAIDEDDEEAVVSDRIDSAEQAEQVRQEWRDEVATAMVDAAGELSL
jgi:hypothetical protein